MLPAARMLLQAARQSSTGATRSDAATCQLPKSFVTAVSAAERLYGACVLERLPVIMPEEPEWEAEHREWQHKMQSRQRKELPEEFTQARATYERDGGPADTEQWKPAPRETEADAAGDTKSLRRKLDQRLFLLVKARGESSWQFPQTEHAAGETMRQTAERAVKETVEDGPQVYFIGNSPMGHVGQSERTAFFHKAQLIKGSAALRQDGHVTEFAWVAKDEMPNYIKDEATQSLLSQMLGN